MYRFAGVVLLLLPALPAAGAEDKSKDKPEEQYKSLVKQYQADLKDVKSFQEQMTLAQDKYAPKFLELAEKDPKDPAAVDALVWVVQNVRGQRKDNPRDKALAILTKDYAKSDKVGPVLQALAYGYDKQNELFLRAVLDQNPSRNLQGQACLALAQNLKNRNSLLPRLEEQPDFAKAIENALGKDYLEYLKKLDPAKADKEVEELFERAEAKYADVKLPGGGTVGSRVKPELFEIRHLAIGMKAPDIQGEDIDGKKFKLSDYKGKVVLLDFWGNW
ncbi:MAG TPA: redoxin domain-containing protein [Gemmataceae bacterium]|nr:redoxin domain-containing protein [Gemmataceae bacterium]